MKINLKSFITMTTKSWIHIYILLFFVLGAVYVINQAMAKPFVQWQAYNEVRVAEIQATLEE